MTSVLHRTLAPAPRAEPARPASHPAFLAALSGSAVAFALAYWAFVRTVGGQWIENAVVLDAQSSYPSDPDLSARTLAGVEVAPWVCAGVLAVLVIGFARRRFATAGVAAGLVVGSLLVAWLLKHTLLVRPDLDAGGAVADHNSFPSGHVSAAVAVLLGLAVVLPHRARPWLLIPGAVGVGWVAYATVLLGWHRPSDTAGASLLVIGICCGALALGSRTNLGVARHSPEGAVVAFLAPAALVGFAYGAVRLVSPDAQSAAGLSGMVSFGLVLYMLWLLTPPSTLAARPGQPVRVAAPRR